ncbi:GNAT family N-acetyltransferase [Nocardia ninae]|uniref:GNAT family N-acetyltransferase n=1 Tax=Nocardia ninae TaxID=356145 RepID=UPI001C99FE6F|nr:GNAT family N-acetyltransferase [Nocardia ninae]
MAEKVRAAGCQIPVAEVVDVERLRMVLSVAEVRGPAALAYCSVELFRPVTVGVERFERVALQDGALGEFLASSGEVDRDESGLDEITSSAFVVRSAGVIASAAGYRVWPNRTAHVSVLTAPDRRGHGFARVAASAAVEHALGQGLVPQWRARSAESRRVAAALGFRELGAQLSFRLNPLLGEDQVR